MTGSLRYMARNVCDLATLSTAVAPFATTPVTNLQKPRRARVFRWNPLSGSPSGQSILGTFGGASYYMSQLGLDRINFTSNALVRVRIYASVTDWSGAADVDTGNLAAYNASVLGPFTWGQSALGVDIKDGYLGFQYFNTYFARTLAKSFRIDITGDDANPDGYLQISRLVGGDYSELIRSAAFGLKFAWKETTVQEEMDGGSLISDGRLPRRSIAGMLPGLAPAERTLFSDFTRFVGKRKAFAFSVQPGEGASLERDYTILQAKFVQMPELGWELPDLHNVPQFEVVEG